MSSKGVSKLSSEIANFAEADAKFQIFGVQKIFSRFGFANPSLTFWNEELFGPDVGWYGIGILFVVDLFHTCRVNLLCNPGCLRDGPASLRIGECDIVSVPFLCICLFIDQIMDG